MSFNVDYIINLRDKASVKLKKLNKQANDTNSGFAKMGSGIGGLLAGAGIAAGVVGIAKLGIEMEQTRVAFSTFLGDAGKANVLIAELNEFANVTPFDNAQIITASKALLTAGVTAEGMTDQLRTIGDVAAGAGVPITELSQIFAKATNKGKLQAEELNQFAERGIPILDVLAKKWGMNKAEVLKMGEKGKITADVMKEAFQTMSGEGGRFFNMMEKQSATAGGKISTLVGKLQMMGIAIGEKLVPVIAKMADKLISFVEFINRNSTIFKVVGGAILGMASAIVTIIGAIKSWVAVQSIINFLLTANPIGLIVVAIGAFVGAIMAAWQSSETFRGVLFGLWEVLKMVGSAVWEWMVAPFRTLWEILKPMIPAVKGFFQGIVDFIKPIGKAIWDFFIKPLKMAIQGVKEVLKFMGILGDGDSVTSKVSKTFSKGFKEGVEDFNKGEKKESAIAGGAESAIAGTTGAALAGAATKTGKGLNSGIDKVTSSAPKTFNINIENLVKDFKISTTNMAEGAEKTKDAILQTLIAAVNDVSVISK